MSPYLIKPFIDSTTHVLSTMCQTSPEAREPRLKDGQSTWGTVTGIIGLTCDAMWGNLVISFDEQTAINIVNKLLCESYTKITSDIVDAVGELTNMIAGGAKQRFSEIGLVFDMATPLMITGRGVTITQLSKTPTIQIPFETDSGTFVVEASLTELRKN